MSEHSAEHPRMDARPILSEGRRAAAMQALPFAIALGIVAFMVDREGAFALTVWSPIALLMLGDRSHDRDLGGSGSGIGSRASVCGRRVSGAFTHLELRDNRLGGCSRRRLGRVERRLLYLLVFALVASWPTTAEPSGRCCSSPGSSSRPKGVVTVEQAIHSADPTST